MMITRTARYNGTCWAPGCRATIWAGARITKPPGRPWQHADCERPGRRSTEDKTAERAARTARRRR